MNIKTNEDLEMVKLMENAVRDLARQRALLIKGGVMTEDEMTDFINEKGEKYGKKYDRMSIPDIVIEAIGEAIGIVKEKADK